MYKRQEGYCPETGNVLVKIDPRYFRPAEVDLLIGDASKAREVLGWTATTPLADMCREMVQADLALFERDAYLQAGGHDVVSPADL